MRYYIYGWSDIVSWTAFSYYVDESFVFLYLVYELALLLSSWGLEVIWGLEQLIKINKHKNKNKI